MNVSDLSALLPLVIIATTVIVVMLVIAFLRDHKLTAVLTLAGLAFAGASLTLVSPMLPHRITPLLILDHYGLFYTGLIFIASFAVAALSYSYLEIHEGHREEFYLLLLLATLGCAVLAGSMHFASLFLGVEILSVSLYALVAYLRHSDRSIEAGVKYLILAAVSSAFILFGMALVYAEIGSMDFTLIAARASSPGVRGLPFTAGLAMIIVGLGFKLAVVPFHLWTPDVYEGAPAPVTAFVSTVSKGAVFAVILRYFSMVGVPISGPLFIIFTIIAIASMFTGNLLALFQSNVKRILAYSSISHLGYLLVTLLASGAMATTAAAFYLSAYFITTLGAFGVVTILSEKDRDADSMADYRSLAWRRPWLAGVFTAMLLSLAGIPLTAGFVGKFYVVAAGVGSGLWFLVIILTVNSALGLYYYLRLIVPMYTRGGEEITAAARLSLSGSAVLAGLTVLLIWLGVYPVPVIQMIQKLVQGLT
ncbi:MAG TPA: NADH-quinone oxidoreductase subunit N [Nitrospirota bacterium]|nr:NADH-quinone oxidoreductase subunit N [Nitrospirota bacterium]